MLSLLLALVVPFGLSAPASSFQPMAAEGEAAGRVAGAPVQQVRIEEGMIVRIPPGAVRRPLPLRPVPRSAPARWRERPIGSCVPLAAIAGSRIEDDSSLLLLMRNRRLVRVRLDRTCSAREFYSGFYVERTADGLLCTGRDMLRSRSGASCSLVTLRRLVDTRR